MIKYKSYITSLLLKHWQGVLTYLERLEFSKNGLLIACIFFGFTLLGDSIAFSLASNYLHSPFYVVVKFFNLIFLIGVVQLTLYLSRKYKQKDQLARRFCKYFGICFAVMAFFWLVSYPGIIGVDESSVLLAARHLDVYASWHHVLTDFWYAFALGIFPSWGAITFLEILFICAVSGYIISQIEIRYGNKASLVAIILLLSPQVLTDSVTPHRISLFAFTELLLIFLLWSYSHFQKKSRVCTRELITIGLLAGLVAAWRTEAIIYLLAMPLCVWIFGKRRQIKFKQVGMLISIMLLVYLPINFVQNLNTDLIRQYQVTGLFAPLSSILKGDDYNSKDKAYVKRVIDKAIDYDRLIAGDNANTVYWERSDRTISSSDLSTFQRLTVKLIVENPSPYLVGALKNYIDSGLYFKGDPTAIDLRSSEGLIMSNVFNDHIRNVGINLLRGLNISDNSVTPIYNIFYANTLIGIILILTGIILAVWRKLVAVIFVAVVIKSSIIFLTMPIPSVYYYYPLGLSGSLLILLTVVHYRKDFFQMMNRFTKQLS